MPALCKSCPRGFGEYKDDWNVDLAEDWKCQNRAMLRGVLNANLKRLYLILRGQCFSTLNEYQGPSESLLKYTSSLTLEIVYFFKLSRLFWFTPSLKNTVVGLEEPSNVLNQRNGGIICLLKRHNSGKLYMLHGIIHMCKIESD